MAWYRNGTVAVTNGSTTVTGTGTTWNTGTVNGNGLIGPDGEIYEIAAVVSDTELTLASAYLGSTQTGQSYKIIPTRGGIEDLVTRINTLLGNFQTVADGPGQGRFPDGTVAEPGIRFTADGDSGLVRISDNLIALVTAGVARLLLDTDKLRTDLPLGIGTDPETDALLHLFKTNSPRIVLEESAQPGKTHIEYNGHHFKVVVYGPDPALGNPLGGATVDLDGVPFDPNTGARGLRVGREADIASTGPLFIQILKRDDVNGVNVVDWDLNYGADSYVLGQGSGNFGVRNPNPNFPLDVAGEFAAYNGRLVDDLPFFRLIDTKTTVNSGNILAGILFNSTAGGTVNTNGAIRAVARDANGLIDLTFSLAATTPGVFDELMRLTAAGFVGHGTNSPARQMHIAGTDPILRMQDTDTPGMYAELRADGTAGRLLISADVGGAGTDQHIEFRAGGVSLAEMRSTGLDLSVPLSGAAVQSSATDITPGKVMTVGAFGLGATAPAFTGNLDSLDEDIAPGFYSFAGASVTGTPPQAGGFWHLHHSRRAPGGGEVQTATRENTGETWRRWRVTDAWSGWFKIYDQTNTVGTVSQVGGVPTGAIIETGSNANGAWTRYADGTQVCTVEQFSSASGGGATWTYPVAFDNPPAVNATCRTSGGTCRVASIESVTATTMVVHTFDGSGSNSVSPTVDMVAIGRWF